MRSTFDELAKELEELRALVASIAPVNTALAGHHDSIVRQYLTIRRRFDYAAFIVALYASFEKFLENLVAAYARLVARRTQYSALPSKLVQKHIAKSAEILLRGRLGEGRYTGIRPVDVVKNLYDCLTDATPYALNDVAVVAHDLNLRRDEINLLFGALGFELICDRIRHADALLEWYCTSKALPALPQEGVPSEIIKQRIDDVVERRNQVAHRGGNPLDLLGPDEMTETVAFIESLSKSIFVMTVARYLHDHHVASSSAVALHLREGPYKYGTVVVVDKPAQRLYVGQPVFVVVDSAGARWGRILSLKVNDNAVTVVEQGTAATDVGIRLDFRCPKNATLYALDADDDVVWSPAAAAAVPAA
jgi:hypothetical protein